MGAHSRWATKPLPHGRGSDGGALTLGYETPPSRSGLGWGRTHAGLRNPSLTVGARLGAHSRWATKPLPHGRGSAGALRNPSLMRLSKYSLLGTSTGPRMHSFARKTGVGSPILGIPCMLNRVFRQPRKGGVRPEWTSSRAQAPRTPCGHASRRRVPIMKLSRVSVGCVPRRTTRPASVGGAVHQGCTLRARHDLTPDGDSMHLDRACRRDQPSAGHPCPARAGHAMIRRGFGSPQPVTSSRPPPAPPADRHRAR
ncbi:MAG: hypothetical protein CHACPFDD_01341 [Phycisphaerae bacterium]|nr:hypothetical protein [Phycisphaerae bacterium]